MKHTIPLLTLLLLTSCDITKSLQKSKSETSGNETIETRTFRKGDTVSYIVPVVRYKDTTIVTYNRQGTTLKTFYDGSGNVSSIDCISSTVEEMKREQREFIQSIKEKDKQKTEDFDSTPFIILGVVLLAIVLLGFLAVVWFVNSKFGAIQKLIP